MALYGTWLDADSRQSVASSPSECCGFKDLSLRRLLMSLGGRKTLCCLRFTVPETGDQLHSMFVLGQRKSDCQTVS
jgi:hypothetical protein